MCCFQPQREEILRQAQDNASDSGNALKQKAPRKPKSLFNYAPAAMDIALSSELFLPEGVQGGIHTFIHGDILQKACDAEHIIDLGRCVA